MHKLERELTNLIENRIEHNPVVALLGPRQCGKSTAAKAFLKNYKNSIYLDLENQKDLAKLNDLWAFFKEHEGKLICFDEVQRAPEVFTQIRSYVDQLGGNSHFLVLGSASRDLIKQSSETLAGRISYIEMTPFRLSEVATYKRQEDLLLKGGFPRSLLTESDEVSFDWRNDYIRTFLERDIPNLGFRVPAQILNRFWMMLAHTHGQILNQNKIAGSLGVTSKTLKHYIHILEETFMVRTLRPYFENIKKRMVKSPKVYIRDSGIVHALLDIESYNDLLGHPTYGTSFEGMVIENLISMHPRHTPYFIKTAKGEEIDLVLVKGGEKLAFEIKASTAPQVEDGFWKAIDLLSPKEVTIIANVEDSYPYKKDIIVHNLESYATSRKA